MVSESTLARVLARAAKNFSFPVRPPSYTQPSFWAEPITITRARPIDPGLGWVDFLSVPDKDSYTKIIRSYVAAPYTEGQVSFRWLRGNVLLDPDTIDIPANVERHINRLVVHPYPARFRPLTFPAFDRTQVVLQVNNTAQDIQLAFAAVYGWYYPDLRDPFEADDLEGIDDAARTW